MAPGHRAPPIALAVRRMRPAAREIELIYLAKGEENEFYFRIAEIVEGREQAVLRAALGLTAREADVLLWVSRGKSNRDASHDVVDVAGWRGDGHHRAPSLGGGGTSAGGPGRAAWPRWR